jgi:DNA-binding MarR family transcriptional regulator
MTIFESIEKPLALTKTVEESVIMTLLKVADNLIKNGDVVCQKVGITTQQWRVMLHLAGDPNIAYVAENQPDRPYLASELADAFNVSRPNITNLVNALIEKELVVQSVEDADRRRKYLRLTNKGRAILETIEPYRHKANQRLLSHLTDKERTQFLTFLESSLDTLTQDFGK